METKLIAAEIATGAGVTTIITSSKRVDNILGIIEYNNTLKSNSVTQEPVSRKSSPDPETPSNPVLLRPSHTVFTPASVPMRDLKSWTRHTLFPSGSVIIDAGAHHVLSRRESGGRLLAAGVLGTIGDFASGQAVRIVILRSETAEGFDVASEAHYDTPLETQPSTPNLVATASLSSSVISLEPLSRPRSTEPHGKSLPPLPEDAQAQGDTRVSEADVVEVGRGLANYNSAQILRVKGMNRYEHPRSSLRCVVSYRSFTARIFRRYWAMLTRSMWSIASLSRSRLCRDNSLLSAVYIYKSAYLLRCKGFEILLVETIGGCTISLHVVTFEDFLTGFWILLPSVQTPFPTFHFMR